jgi:hypothetical protein
MSNLCRAPGVIHQTFHDRSGRRHLARVAFEVRTSAHHFEGTQTMDEMGTQPAVEPSIDDYIEESSDYDADGRDGADETEEADA